MEPHTSGNQLWTRLTARPCQELTGAVTVPLRARDVLQEPGLPVLHAYFPLTSVVSLVSRSESGTSTEVALVGREGMVGLSGLLSRIGGMTEAVVQVAGTAVRVPTRALRHARDADSEVRRSLDLYTEARLIQVAQSALCNRLHPLEARLSRWLLAIHDRVDGDAYVVSQELIAEMLGVHRPTVSVALQRLQQEGAIQRRGRAIVVASRTVLERLACECHDTLRREFHRLLTREATTRWPPVRAPVASDRPPEVPPPEAADHATREVVGRLLLASLREQAARERAEALSRNKDDFLATLSHELRTPMNAIAGWCQILLERGLDPDTDRGLRIIDRNVRAQLAMIEQLLDTARIASGTFALEASTIDPMDLLQTAVDAVTPAARDRRVELRLLTPDPLPPLQGDAARLRQVLVNVIQNAVKVTPPHGSVEVRSGMDGEHVRLVVHDTGRGIAPDLLPEVFQRFRQGPRTTGVQQGLGLGLAIARAIVDAHGGTIWLDSAGEGRGTTCTIVLPLPRHAD